MKKLTVISLSLILAGMLFLIFACAKSEELKTTAKDNSSTNTLAPSSAAKTSVLAIGSEECSNGGVKIQTGIDENMNGVLDDNEVDNTAYVCNGTPGETGDNGTKGLTGLSSLISSENESAGSNCTTGGIKIIYGIDDNNNGVLESSEVDDKAFVCNGIPGATGDNGTKGSTGLSSLISSENESVGSNCTTGGIKISYGIDDNNNGVLESSEVDDSVYVCNGTSGEANDNGSIIYGITTPPTGYAAFSTLSSLQSGDALKLRLNRTGTQIDEHTVYFDSIYDGGERLLLLKTDKKLIVGAGDSGSPVLTEEGKVVAALCYGWNDNKYFFAARAIEDMLDLQNLPSAQRIQSNTVSNFDLLGLSGPAVELRKTHSFFSRPNSYAVKAYSGRAKDVQEYRSNYASVDTLQPGNTIAVIDVYGDLTMIAAYGTISYSLNEEWLAFGHNYNLSGEQISKPVYPAKMITMIDRFPVARKLTQAYGDSVGAMTADYFEGIRIKRGATAPMISTTTQLNYDNITKNYTHQVAYDIDQDWGAAILSYAMTVPLDYTLRGVIRGGTGTGTLRINFDNSTQDNHSLSFDSSYITQTLYSTLYNKFDEDNIAYKTYGAIQSTELELVITTD